MLRSFEYHPKRESLVEVLQQFQIEVPKLIPILRFEVITPDSFMWRLQLEASIYYLYAEDFVPSLAHIKSIFDKYLESKKWELIKAKKPKQFEDSSPVAGADVYERPKEVKEMMKYAVDSASDFAFLARSQEPAGEGRFSDSAPRGFIR